MLYKNKIIEALKKVFNLCLKDHVEYRYDNDEFGIYFLIFKTYCIK